MERSAFVELPADEQLSLLCQFQESNQNGSNYLKWFCQLHHPRSEHPNVQTELKNYIQHNDFLDVLQSIKPDDCQEEYVDILWMIARIDEEGIENEIVKRFINTLQSIISTNLQNERIIEKACIVIGLVSIANTDEDNYRNILVNAEIIDYLVSILKLFSKNGVMIQRACKALTNACYHNAQTKLSFIDNGGFSVLLGLLKSDISVAAKRCCAQLLRTVVHLNEEHHHTILLSTELLIQNIVTTMKENENDAITQWHFLWTILNLSINQKNTKKEFGRRNVCQVVMHVMKIHKDEQYIQQTAITTLRQLATIVTNRMILAREQFPAVLVSFMEQPTTEPSLIVTILETLRRLCLTGLNRKLLATPALLGKFREVAKVYINNVSIANVALNVLANLAHGANATRVGLKTNGIIEFLNSVMVVHQHNTELVDDAHEIAHIIPHEGDVEEETSSESQSDSEDEDYSGDDDVSKYINELKENDSQSINLESLKRTQENQEAEILLLKKQIEEKEDCFKRYTKKISELSKDLESQFDSSRETLQIQNANSLMAKDLEEKKNMTFHYGQVIDTTTDQHEKGTEKFLLLGNEEEEISKRNEEIVSQLKQKIEMKKKIIKEQQEEIAKIEEAKKKAEIADLLFQDTKTQLLSWIQLAIKLEGISNGSENNFDKEILDQKIKQNFIIGLGIDDEEI